MPDIVLVLLKYAFLVLLYLFIARAVRTVYLELRPESGQTTPSPAQAPRREARAREAKPKRAPRKAAVVEGDQLRGKSFELGSELTIGRGDSCRVVLTDPYVSQVHARIYARGDDYVIEDLGSTNGTYLNRRRITGPATLQRGDRVKIGKTVLEMRR